MYHPTTEEIVDVLINRTGADDRPFMRNLVAFYMSSITSMMRINIRTQDRGSIPVNMYAINLAHSGFGKNYASNTLEEILLKPFESQFMVEIFNNEAKKNLNQLILYMIRHNPTLKDDEKIKEDVHKEYEELGEYITTFDSATSAAVKQLRKKLLMANAGSLNLIIDEVGSNITNNIDVLTDYLSLYDKGLIKSKIIKSTSENKRGVSVDGVTPANLLMFGTPSKLLNGGKTEEEFFTLLETGYARRLLFAYVKNPPPKKVLTAEELYEQSMRGSDSNELEGLKSKFMDLADYSRFNTTLTMTKDATIRLLTYKQDCEINATKFKSHQEINKAEMAHRYYKALKLAGTYAFIDGKYEVDFTYLNYAIAVVEDSGAAFQKLMNRERNYVKLARYLADIESEVTQVDLTEDLPFYNGSESKKRELMNLAVAYGYKNNIIIKRNFSDSIEFFKGESLEETDIEDIIVAYSEDIAHGYQTEHVPFDVLHELTQAQGYHWITHDVRGGHRKEENCTEGTNLVVLDVDKDVSLELAKMLLKEYKYHMYTTKRHTTSENRFRIVLPLSHIVKLDADNYKQFMENIYNWLPFPVDTQTGQRSRKWLSNDGQYYNNEGVLLDATQFIPKTRKADEQRQYINEHSDLSSLERWFTTQAESEGRNNILIRYGFALIDKGYKFEHIREAVFDFNQKLRPPLTKDEINNTVIVSLAKRLQDKE